MSKEKGVFGEESPEEFFSRKKKEMLSGETDVYLDVRMLQDTVSRQQQEIADLKAGLDSLRDNTVKALAEVSVVLAEYRKMLDTFGARSRTSM